MSTATAPPPSTPLRAAATPRPDEGKRWVPPPAGEWNYDDYCHLPDDGVQYEVIEGVPYLMPAPLVRHQLAGTHLATDLAMHLRPTRAGVVLTAPIDVLLADDATPVQPDVLVVLKDRLSIVKDKFVEGAPDLVVEVLSPSNKTRDRVLKFRLYQKHGVKEYWLVDREMRTIEIFVLRESALVPLGKWGHGEVARGELLPRLEVRVEDVFAGVWP